MNLHTTHTSYVHTGYVFELIFCGRGAILQQILEKAQGCCFSDIGVLLWFPGGSAQGISEGSSWKRVYKNINISEAVFSKAVQKCISVHSVPLVLFTLTQPPFSVTTVFFASDRTGLLQHGACDGLLDHFNGIVGRGFVCFTVCASEAPSRRFFEMSKSSSEARAALNRITPPKHPTSERPEISIC